MKHPMLQLPDRQLRLPAKSITVNRGAMFGIVLFLALAGGFLWWQVPGLWRDWQISQNPVVWDGDITNGECTTRKAVFTDCEAHLAYEVNGTSYESDLSFMFVDIHTGDYWVDLVISGDKPELATMSLAIEKLWNRIIVLGCFVALFGGLVVAGIWQFLRARRESALLAQPGRLTPMLVDLGIQQRNLVGYFDRLKGPKSQRQLMTEFKPGQSPLVVVDEAGNLRGVAVKHAGAALPALLDAELQRLDLTDAERSAALEPLRAQQATLEVAKKPSVMRKIGRSILTGLGVILLLVLLAMGYWLYYVTSGSSQYDAFGMEVNNILPGPVNEWGCDQLQKRFGDQNAPFGCTAADHTSWK